MPIAPPERFQIRKSTLAPQFWRDDATGTKGREHFFSTMEAIRVSLCDDLADSLIAGLNSRGCEAARIEDVPKPGFILRLAFADVGMATKLWSTYFEPKLNLSAYLWPSIGPADYLCTDFFYYGAESSDETSWSIPSVLQHRFVSIEEIFDRPNDVAVAFENAIEILAARIAGRVSALVLKFR